MAKIVEYALIKDRFDFVFDKEVNRYLAAGWELYGEPQIAGVYGDDGHGAGDEPIFCCIQAVVRPEGVPPFKSSLDTKPTKAKRKPSKRK